MARQRRLHRPHCHASVADQDLDHVILRGLLLRVPNLDVITVHQADLSNASDPEILAWAAQQERIRYASLGWNRTRRGVIAK